MFLSMQELRDLHATLAANPEVREFYSHFPRNTWWAEDNLECSARLIEQSRTAEELIQGMQRTYLFSVNTDADSKNLAVQWLLAKYREQGLDVLALPPEIEESSISYEGNCVVRSGRRLSVDFFRSLGGASTIRKLIQKDSPPMRAVELGAGLGHLARVLRLMGVTRQHWILDLPETLVFSYSFLTLNFPTAKALFVTSAEEAEAARLDDYDFVFVPSCFARRVHFDGADIFLNTASLGEMRNETIRYWMKFVHEDLPVKHLFVQNRFLNVIDPTEYAWRWSENESSLRLGREWEILGWDLEPTWFRCPYVVSISSRQLEIAATRQNPVLPKMAETRSQAFIAEVKAQDWLQRAAEPPFMNMRQNPFVTDVTMSGTLFRLWEAIRLNATDEAVYLMLRYLKVLRHNPETVFEETRFYEDLLFDLVDERSPSHIRAFSEELMQQRVAMGHFPGHVDMVASTRDYNIVSVELAVNPESHGQRRTYFALLRTLGPLNILRERIGQRDLPPFVLQADSAEQAMARARVFEN